MDGSERIVYEEGTPEAAAYSSQPQVIVERVAPDDLIEEEIVTEEGATVEEQIDPPQHNGDTEVLPAGVTVAVAPIAVTLNDIIADAVAPEDETDEVVAPEESAGDAPVEGEEAAAKAEPEEEEAEEEVTPSRRKEEPSLDLNQCRCCTAREDLQDIFEPLPRDPNVPVSQLITKLCNKVTITKRDHLPNVICKSCVYKLEIAWEFRDLCEKTDQELRKSLPRAKNKVRKRTDYTLIDYESSSGDDAGGNVDDEDEFKLSDELEEASEASDSDVDFSEQEKKPRKRGRPKKTATPARTPAKVPMKPVTGTTPTTTPRGRGRPPKNAATGSAAKAKSPRAPIEYVEAKEEDESSEEEEEDSDDDEYEEAPAKKKPKAQVTPAKGPATPKTGTPTTPKQCPKCKAVLGKGVHTCKQVTFSCSFCAEKFATHPLYMNHQQLHTNFQSANTCVRCHKKFPDKAQLRKHQSGIRCHKATKNNCLSCGRLLANAAQLAIHLRTKCVPPGKTQPSPGQVGRPATVKKELVSPKKEKNPFKFVAPPTTTYWSDSFSE